MYVVLGLMSSGGGTIGDGQTHPQTNKQNHVKVQIFK